MENIVIEYIIKFIVAFLFFLFFHATEVPSEHVAGFFTGLAHGIASFPATLLAWLPNVAIMDQGETIRLYDAGFWSTCSIFAAPFALIDLISD